MKNLLTPYLLRQQKNYTKGDFVRVHAYGVISFSPTLIAKMGLTVGIVIRIFRDGVTGDYLFYPDANDKESPHGGVMIKKTGFQRFGSKMLATDITQHYKVKTGYTFKIKIVRIRNKYFYKLVKDDK